MTSAFDFEKGNIVHPSHLCNIRLACSTSVSLVQHPSLSSKYFLSSFVLSEEGSSANGADEGHESEEGSSAEGADEGHEGPKSNI